MQLLSLLDRASGKEKVNKQVNVKDATHSVRIYTRGPYLTSKTRRKPSTKIEATLVEGSDHARNNINNFSKNSEQLDTTASYNFRIS